MTEQQKHFPEFYVTTPQPCPYLPGRQERKLFTHLTHEKPLALIDNLLKGGFRRSQNIAYMPYCEGCHTRASRCASSSTNSSRAGRCGARSNATAT
jgi:leucyl-tRNA---protein transferase